MTILTQDFCFAKDEHYKGLLANLIEDDYRNWSGRSWLSLHRNDG